MNMAGQLHYLLYISIHFAECGRWYLIKMPESIAKIITVNISTFKGDVSDWFICFKQQFFRMIDSYLVKIILKAEAVDCFKLLWKVGWIKMNHIWNLCKSYIFGVIIFNIYGYHHQLFLYRLCVLHIFLCLTLNTY